MCFKSRAHKNDSLFVVIPSFYFCTGSLILEMGALSKLTGDPIYESVALRALHKLWSMRSSLNLFGTTLDVETGEWLEFSSGIGAGRFFLNWHILYLSVHGISQYISCMPLSIF